MDVRYRYKCAFLGESGSGKTSIINSYIGKKFNENCVSTIGAAYNTTYIDTNYGSVRLEIWDTAGQERFDSIIPIYYKNADIIFFVYDITSQLSYVKAKNWINKIMNETNNNPILVLVANKSDLVNIVERDKEIDDMIEKGIIYYYIVSAKNGSNIRDVFVMSANLSSEKSNNIENNIETLTSIKLENKNVQQQDLCSEISKLFKLLIE